MITPFEVAFLPPPTTPLEPLFIANRIIDLIFSMDIVLQFVLMVEHGTESMTQGAQWHTQYAPASPTGPSSHDDLLVRSWPNTGSHPVTAVRGPSPRPI